VREALADVLTSIARAVRGAGRYSAAAAPADATLAALGDSIAELQERRDHLAGLLAVDPSVDQGAWQQHGALLAGVDRLKVEVEAAVHPPEQVWRPAPVAQRQRQAVRRAVSAPVRHPPWRRR